MEPPLNYHKVLDGLHRQERLRRKLAAVDQLINEQDQVLRTQQESMAAANVTIAGLDAALDYLRAKTPRASALL